MDPEPPEPPAESRPDVVPDPPELPDLRIAVGLDELRSPLSVAKGDDW